MFDTLRDGADRLKRELHALGLAYLDPRTPWYARAWLACVLGYALSPIDLISDFIPVLGYLDDLVLLPAGIWLALRLVPEEVIRECRTRASEGGAAGSTAAVVIAALVVGLWLLAAALTVTAIVRWLI